MTTLQIQYFLTVADYMSFSRAAEALFVSQPSVSRQIKLLEGELGFQLFDRTQKNRISLTPAGILFQECFRGAAQSVEAARTAARELSNQSALRLRVGIGTGWELSEELRRFRSLVLSQYPQAELHFECNTFQALRQRLQANELDVTMCTKTSVMDFDGLEVRQIANPESRAYVRKGLLRPEGEPLRVEDFNGQTLFMLQEEESPMAMELALLQLQSRQVTVNPVWLPDRESIVQAVLMGDGFTVFDQYVHWRDEPRLTYYRLDDMIPICIVWRKNDHNPLIGLLADTLMGSFSRQEQN